jgi:hypothetical protein
MTSIRHFKLVFTILGLLYIIMASSMLVSGAAVLGDFGVPESVFTEPVLADTFLFFYQLMAYVGVLTVLFGHVARERSTQLLVASVFFIANIMTALHDLSTADCQFGNHLYKGEKTVVFVYISLAYAAAYGYLVVRGAVSASSPNPRK